MSFLDDDFLKDTEQEIEKKESEMAGDKREKMSAGVYKMFLCKIETETDAKNVPMVKLIYNVDADQKTFRDLVKVFRFDENDSEKLLMNKKMFVEHFWKSFKYKFKPADLKGAINQIKKFEGKQVMAAVQIKQRLMKKFVKDEDGKDTSDIYGYMVIDVPQLYYTGLATEELTLKAEKKFVKLKEKELEEYEDHKIENPDKYDENGKLVFQDSNHVAESADNLSIGSSSTGSTSDVDDDPLGMKAPKDNEGLPWD